MNDTVGSSPPGIVHRVLHGPSELRAGWRLLLFLALVMALLSVGNLVVRRLLPAAGEATLFLVREVMDVLVFLLASRIMGRIEGRSLADYGLPWRKMLRLRFWQGVLLGFASITGLVIAMRALGVLRFGGVELHGLEIWKWATVYALVFVLVAVREEFRARGYLLYTLSAGIGFWPAAALSSALFGWAHRGNPGEDWMGLLNAGVFGLLACFLLRRTGDLWMPIGFHTAFNWGETYLYGAAVSGRTLPGGLLDSSTSGPSWLSGGSVGPEGSVLCTLLFVAVWLAVAVRLRAIRYPDPAPRSS